MWSKIVVFTGVVAMVIVLAVACNSNVKSVTLDAGKNAKTIKTPPTPPPPNYRTQKEWVIERDSWYKEAPSYWLGKGKNISGKYTHKVIGTKEKEAENLLKDVSVVELTTEKAEEFIGGKMANDAKTKPYLVRGLRYRGMGTGGFFISIYKDQLRVDFSCLGGGPCEQERQAFVVQLEQMPTNVFVTLGMAE